MPSLPWSGTILGLINPIDISTTILPKVGKCSSNDTAIYPRRLVSSRKVIFLSQKTQLLLAYTWGFRAMTQNELIY
jgi:hypothetical protein